MAHDPTIRWTPNGLTAEVGLAHGRDCICKPLGTAMVSTAIINPDCPGIANGTRAVEFVPADGVPADTSAAVALTLQRFDVEPGRGYLMYVDEAWGSPDVLNELAETWQSLHPDSTLMILPHDVELRTVEPARRYVMRVPPSVDERDMDELRDKWHAWYPDSPLTILPADVELSAADEAVGP